MGQRSHDGSEVASWLRRSGRWALRCLSAIGRHELGILVVLALVFASIWLFVELAEEVVSGETQSLDELLLTSLRSADDLSDPIGPRWLEEACRDLTALGGFTFLSFLTLAVVGFLLLQRKTRQAVFVVAAISSGVLMSTVLKQFFDRPRPQLVPHESIVYTASFPSGHSTMAAVTYLTLFALLARSQPRVTVRAYLLSIGIVLTLLVGFSRVYVGVHWPTDVVAGWTAGAGWALAAWLIARALQRRGNLESTANDETDSAPIARPPPSGTER